MDSYTEIKNKIRAMTGRKTPLLLTGRVESVDGETCTVSVGDLKLTGVRLRSVVNGESSKLLITPKQGSYVTLIDLSGELRETEVVGSARSRPSTSRPQATSPSTARATPTSTATAP